MLESGNFDQALTVFEGLVATAPQDSSFRTYLGATLANLERHEDAFREFTAALRLDPKNVDALVARGELLVRANQIPLALDDFEKALKLDPQRRMQSTHRAQTIISKLAQAADAAKQAAPKAQPAAAKAPEAKKPGPAKK